MSDPGEPTRESGAAPGRHALTAEEVLASQRPASGGGLPTRLLGRTGERVSILGLGGWDVGSITEDREAIRFVHAALDEGVTFFDNAWDYHDGRAEELMGRALSMDGRRQRVFLMTKVCDRDHAGAMRQLDDSLRRLRTDHLDLWQFHEINWAGEPDWIFEAGGIRAALEARDAGKVRYVGFTGHKDPAYLRAMLDRPFDWDACQMPVNVMDASYRSFRDGVVPHCLARGVGVIGMKGLGGYGAAIVGAGRVRAAEAYRYALSQPVATQVSGMSSLAELHENVAVARKLVPMSAAEQSELVARTRGAARGGRCEPFKSTTDFEGPHHKRQHGESTP